MFSALYTTGIHTYETILHLVASFNPKARKWVDGRHNWAERLSSMLYGNTAPIAWFHAASLGEFEQGRPVIEAFRVRYPDHKILLTFFSPSGYEVRKAYAGADYIIYLPADTPANARQFITLVKPVIAFFIKYEFWYNYLHELKTTRIPVISFSAIFRPDQLFFRPWGGFYRSMLGYFRQILVQNQESVELLRRIGITNVILGGDTRFDRVAQVAAAKQDIPLAREFKNRQPVLVVGSAWQADIDILIPFLNGFEEPLKIIIAPHDIHDDEIERWRVQFAGRSVRFSQTNESDAASANVLFIDNVGMLSSLYQYGEFAYIGGAFGKGLHNVLEAATFGMPLFFGPNYRRFQEATDLVNEGAAFTVTTTDDLGAAFRKQYVDPSVAARVSRDYVQRNIGATAQVMTTIEAIFNPGQ